VAVIANVIIHANFFVSWFRGFGVLTPRNFAISIGLAGLSYNSVNTAVLHCDLSFKKETLNMDCSLQKLPTANVQ